jgi:tRNA(Arg) A34 adenosine deaminase TadA
MATCASWIHLPSGETLAVREDSSRGERASSTIARLIESVYETESDREPSEARFVLREWIFSTETPSISDRELVKSAAKRLRAPEPEPDWTELRLRQLRAARVIPDFRAETASELSGFGVGQLLPESELRARLVALRAFSELGEKRWRSDRPVSAILLDREGRVLGFSWNTNSLIRNRHAEWNLCETLRAQEEKIPRGATLYVSLKPCRMCAARIWESSEDPSAVSVVYLENDPGRAAQGTLLDFESPARVRYFGVDSPEFRYQVQSRFED